MYIRERCYRVPTTEDCTRNVLRLLLSLVFVFSAISIGSRNAESATTISQHELLLPAFLNKCKLNYLTRNKNSDHMNLLLDITALFKQLSVFSLVSNKMLPNVK